MLSLLLVVELVLPLHTYTCALLMVFRDTIGQTNRRLLELLSGAVDSQRSLESRVLHKIGCPATGRSTPMSRSSSRADGKTVTLTHCKVQGHVDWHLPLLFIVSNAAVAGAAAAASSVDTPRNEGGAANQPHEKSFDSEMADEGLDLSHISQTREESMFVGPHLHFTEEEMIHGNNAVFPTCCLHPQYMGRSIYVVLSAESGRHLQEVVDMLLSRIENAASELAAARSEQETIMQQLADRNSRVSELERFCP